MFLGSLIGDGDGTLVRPTSFQLKIRTEFYGKYARPIENPLNIIINTSFSQRKIVQQISSYLANCLTVLEVLEVPHQ